MISVLLVDDHPVVIEGLRKVLATAGDIAVTAEAHDAAAAIERARALKPDVILLDLHLPDVSGAEVAVTLRADETTRAIPVIVLSADAYASQRRRLVGLGVDAYLTKPFHVAELTRLVEQLVARHGRTR